MLLLDHEKNSPGGECCNPLFNIEKATYNEVEVEIIGKASEIEKIIVVK